MDCWCAAGGDCEELHTIRSVRSQLQLQLGEQHLEQGLEQEQALAALEVLAGDCYLSLRSHAGRTLTATIQPGQQAALRTLLLLLAGQGLLHRVSEGGDRGGCTR